MDLQQAISFCLLLRTVMTVISCNIHSKIQQRKGAFADAFTGTRGNIANSKTQATLQRRKAQ